MARLNHKGEYWDHLDLVEVFRDVADVNNVGTLVGAGTKGTIAYELNGVAPAPAGTVVRVGVRDGLEIQQVETVTVAGVVATETLSLTANPLDTETITVNGRVYTYLDTLTGAADEIHIGATQSDTVDNTVLALSAGAGAGTDYGLGTTVNLDITGVNNAGDLDVTAKYIGTAGHFALAETLSNGSWGAGNMSGGVNQTGNMRFPFSRNIAAGTESASQTGFDLGNILDAGARITFSGDHNPVNAATKRLVTAYLTGHAEIMAEFELLGFALENLAVAVGMAESSVVGSGTTSAPDTLAITADDFNTENDLSWRLTGATKDGQIVLVDLWATENDFSAVNFAMQRGTPAPVPVRAKSTSGLRISKYT